MRILPAENLRFPGEGSSAQGKPGPKPRPKGVGDGQRVEIPVPPIVRLKDGVTQKGKLSARLEMRVQASRARDRQNRLASSLRGDGEGNSSTEVTDPMLPRKTSNEDRWCPYRKPTQVGRVRILRRAREPSLRNSAN